MSNAAKLKKKAVELEQKKQFDKALALYIQFLQESDGAIDDVDVPLYNRVGDLMLRTGNASDALNYYEKAVDLYAERGFLNNAIALCNKVLRQSPGRASIYYKLGKISASKGFKSDAKKNFLEYADRMQKAGQIDEAFRALKEFADLCPDQDDIRLMLAEQLTKENRGEEALEQLQKLHDKLDSEGRTAEARATVDRMKSIDPEAVPRVSGSYRPQKSQDLIFLDTSFEQKARQRQSEPVPAPPPSRQVSDPDLVVLSFDQPDTPATPVASVAPPTPVASITPVAAASPVDNAAIADTFELDIAPPNEVAAAAVELPLLEVPVDDAFTLASDVPAPVEMRFDAPVPSLDLNVEPDPAPVDLVLDQPHYVTGPPLSVDYAGDLAVDVSLPIDDDGGLFDFRAPPRSDDAEPSTAGLGSLDPDVAFPSFDLDDTALPSADEVTSGGSLAAALGDDLTLGSSEFSLPDPPDLEMVSASLDEPFLSNEPAAVDVQVTEPAAATPADALDLEWSSASATETPAASVAAVDLDGLELDTEPATLPIESLEVDAVEHIDVAAESAHAAAASSGDAYELIDDTETAVDIAVTSSADMAIDGHDTAAPNAEPQTEPAADDVDAPAVDFVAEAGRAAAMLTPVAAPVQSADAIIPADQPEQPAPAGWEVQRAHAERLLEAGDRAGGVRELETVAAELERLGDLERALSIVDELIRLSPDSVRHHQKRVELAFRSSDRVKLIDAYLELGDALFRSGEERKARAVYQRVLELAPDDPRAQAAVESVSSMSPPMGSGAIPAITASTATPEARPAQQRPRDTHVPYQPGPNHVNRPAAAVSAPPATRKPSPLDRSAAANGEFVDLGEWLRSGENPKSTRMVAEEKPPTGDEQADFQEMLKRFKQGIAENVEEEDYESHYDLGVAYKEMGLIDEAVAEFQKALRGTSNRVRTYEALGQCFVEKDQYHVAASVLTRAIALGNGDDHHLVGVLYLLARATEALSNPAAALDYYQRVFAVDIEFRDVAERISAIERKAT